MTFTSVIKLFLTGHSHGVMLKLEEVLFQVLSFAPCLKEGTVCQAVMSGFGALVPIAGGHSVPVT